MRSDLALKSEATFCVQGVLTATVAILQLRAEPAAAAVTIVLLR